MELKWWPEGQHITTLLSLTCLLLLGLFCKLAQLPVKCPMPDVRVAVMLLLCRASENELVSRHKMREDQPLEPEYSNA